jgi:hypothetical protein
MKATILAGRLQPDRVIAWVVAGLLAVPLFVLLVRVLHSGWLPEMGTHGAGVFHDPSAFEAPL